MEDIERIFYDEIREKKRIGYGVHHMKGHGVKGGIRGGMKTQVDYLKGKEKRNYTKGSAVMESNLYDKIENLPTFNELKSMDKEKAKNILQRTKEHNTNKTIMDKLKTSSGSLYNFYDLVGVEYNKNRNKRKVDPTTVIETKPKDQKIPKTRKSLSKEVEVITNQEEVAVAAMPNDNMLDVIKDSMQDLKVMIFNITNNIKNESPGNGLELKFKSELTGEDISNKIINYIGALDKDTKYKINFTVSEVL